MAFLPLADQAGPSYATGSAVYYVSAAGSDTNSGTSPETPWRTIARANAVVRPGTTVVLKGAFVKQAIAPARSGTAAAPITYKAAGAGASLDQPGLVGSTPYEVYLGDRSYVTISGLTIGNSNFVDEPVANKGVVLRSSDHITFTNNTFDHMQMQLIGSDENTIANNRWRYFVASYVDPTTGRPDPSHPQTAGDMLNVVRGSDRNLITGNDMSYGGHSLIEIGNGTGNSDVNAANVIRDNKLSNPWYKPLILSDDGAGTVVDGNTIADATTDPKLYDTRPGQVDAVAVASAGVQFSGSNFTLTHNLFVNDTAEYGVITLGSRWYFDATHPDGVLVESRGNTIANNTITDCHAAAAVSFVIFQSAADDRAGRQVPVLTGNTVTRNIFWANTGTAGSWNGSLLYTTLILDAARYAPAWPSGGYGGNRVTNNDFDDPATASLTNVYYRGRSTHVVQTLHGLERASRADVFGNVSVDPQFSGPRRGDYSLAASSPVFGFGA